MDMQSKLDASRIEISGFTTQANLKQLYKEKSKKADKYSTDKKDTVADLDDNIIVKEVSLKRRP